MTLGRQEAEVGDLLDALDHTVLAMRNFHDSGNTAVMRVPLAWLATFLDRPGHYDPAATAAGFAVSPLTAASFPNLNTTITHLREVLGDEAYEWLANKGKAMTATEMVTYAYDQIDQARAELNAVSKYTTYETRAESTSVLHFPR
jgi:hypothetical protein